MECKLLKDNSPAIPHILTHQHIQANNHQMKRILMSINDKADITDKDWGREREPQPERILSERNISIGFELNANSITQQRAFAYFVGLVGGMCVCAVLEDMQKNIFYISSFFPIF